MKDSGCSGGVRGFTLIEVLVAVTILAVVMSVLYGTFSASSANARVVEERADDLSSLTGALDTISHEIRGVYSNPEGSPEGVSGKKQSVTFTTSSPFAREGEPTIQRVSYLFEDERLVRKVLRTGSETEVKGESLLLVGVKDPSFSFFNGKEWVDEWSSEKKIPAGVRVMLSYKRREVDTVIPVWSAQR